MTDPEGNTITMIKYDQTGVPIWVQAGRTLWEFEKRGEVFVYFESGWGMPRIPLRIKRKPFPRLWIWPGLPVVMTRLINRRWCFRTRPWSGRRLRRMGYKVLDAPLSAAGSSNPFDRAVDRAVIESENSL